jgi:hypothetical protein
MARAAAAISGAASPSQLARSIRPCRRAFCAARTLPAAVRGPVLPRAFRAERSFPSGVRGPVLLRALARLAASFAALVMPARPPARGAGQSP